MSKVKKPTSITTIKECEEALEWIDLELDKLDRNIRITSRAIFSPKKWTTAISGILRKFPICMPRRMPPAK